MEDWVYQIRNGKTIIGKKPKKAKESTEAQLQHRERFAEAVAFASEVLADPARREFYVAMAEKLDRKAFPLAVSDFLNPPSFKPFDLEAYRGQVGDTIVINAETRFGLVWVEVSLVASDGTPIEKGNAVETRPCSNKWVYTATAPVAPGTHIFVKVTGLDHAGHKTIRNENPVVGVDE
jgi:hypothetical protein